MDMAKNQQIDMEKEFTPHMWSTKFQTPKEVLDNYIDFITIESELAEDLVPHEANVKYGRYKSQKLDIFGTDLPDDAPIFVYIHGGFWKKISKNISRFPALSFHKAGIKTIVVGYSQGPKAQLHHIIEQLEDAVVYILKYAQEKGSRGVYLAGHNSGAHLIGKVLSNYELFNGNLFKQLNGVFFISGIYDLRELCFTSANEDIDVFEMDAPSFSPLFDNYAHLQDLSTKFYIFAAEEDSPTFQNQARSYYELLLDICPTKNMYFEIKDDMDHFDIVKCLTTDNNYIKQLILNDLREHS